MNSFWFGSSTLARHLDLAKLCFPSLFLLSLLGMFVFCSLYVAINLKANVILIFFLKLCFVENWKHFSDQMILTFNRETLIEMNC